MENNIFEEIKVELKKAGLKNIFEGYGDVIKSMNTSKFKPRTTTVIECEIVEPKQLPDSKK